MQFSDRELITIVAALRHWQGSSASAPQRVHDVLYGWQQMTVPEIDALCYRIQPDTPDKPYIDPETEGDHEAGFCAAANAALDRY